MQFKGTGSLLLKDLDAKQGIVQAYWSAFNNIDDGNDIVMPGNWTKSIKERGPRSGQPRIKFLYQHDEKMVIAKPSELAEDHVGLLATYQIPPTTLGKDVLILYEYGVLSEHSVGYETVRTQWDAKSSARLLLECVLWEGSVVTWGMNSETPVVALKSLAQPTNLTAMAARAQKLDKLLHDGNLQSDDLCQTLDRELKALHAALAPSDTPQPYTIQGVTESMNALATRLSQKAANDDDKTAQAARSKKYGIGIKDGGHVTKPGDAAHQIDDSLYGDPVNYRYPMGDESHARNALSRWGDESNREQYTAAEQTIITSRIHKRCKALGIDVSDDDKGANMSKRLIKGSGGDVSVAADGTHEAYTGTHTHSHKAYGVQGDDDMHDHKHTHNGDATHEHPADHTKTNAAETSARHQHPQRKARDFATLFQSLAEGDQLQDMWGDTFIAFTRSMSELMYQASAVRNGWTQAEGFDLMTAAQANLDDFSAAVMALISRSDAADFCPSLDYDGDQFLDPDGCNAMEDSDWKARDPLAMPTNPPILRKDGRAISNANRAYITSALDGMAMHMKGMAEHHASMVDLMQKTDPDHTRQDEDATQGDDDTNNGGTNPNKSTPRRTAAKAGTTHQGQPHAAIIADFDAITSRISSRKAGQ